AEWAWGTFALWVARLTAETLAGSAKNLNAAGQRYFLQRIMESAEFGFWQEARSFPGQPRRRADRRGHADPTTGPSLLLVGGRQRAEDDGELFGKCHVGDPAGALAGHVVEVRCFATNDGAEADDSIETGCFGEHLGSQWELEGTGNTMDFHSLLG